MAEIGRKVQEKNIKEMIKKNKCGCQNGQRLEKRAHELPPRRKQGRGIVPATYLTVAAVAVTKRFYTQAKELELQRKFR